MASHEGLQAERKSMLAAGMEQLSKSELLNRLDRLGYKILAVDSFNYGNNGNANRYPARSIYIIEKDSKLSFANIDARRGENFKALQQLRYSSFAIVVGRLYEL
jgi:hypothetical protein